VFRAEQVLAKHDENYMPPEAADALAKARKGELPGGAMTTSTNSMNPKASP
jgi:cytochrome c-type biogenesis protein CcmE